MTECGPADNGYCNVSGQGGLATVARDATGYVITFSFAGNGLAPGQSSVDFVLEANVASFINAAVSVFGANSTSASNINGIFSPSGTTSTGPPPPTTPIPSTALLGLTGLAALGLYYGWRKRQAQA